MPGLNSERLVLVSWTRKVVADDARELTKTLSGTGYFVTADLVLTASHVVPEEPGASISLRSESGEPRWRKGARVVWRDDECDAVLIRTTLPLPATADPVQWADAPPAADEPWSSAAYPDAAAADSKEGGEERKSAGLRGTVFVHGGGGQGKPELDLGVDSAALAQGWEGISGAPVFVGDRLAGIIKSVPTGFGGRRLNGLPASSLFQNPGFRLALAPSWLEPPASGPWVLVLVIDSAEELAATVKGSLERHDELVTKVAGQSLIESIVTVRLGDVLRSPEHWLRFVEALCAAPIMIADVTGFEPGVMLALGVRAVVRRGLTITSTANPIDETALSKLPFNIQETKLISHGDGERGMSDEHPRFSLNIIARTIVDGLVDSRSNPRYLDLPAYEAVRCPAPELPSEHAKARETVLVLCSFHKDYAEQWDALSKALVKRYPVKRVVRMLDIASPRLVGQALYENIRWAKTCVVDWTGWRPSVFFELGVRLACSSVEPVCLLKETDSAGPSQEPCEALRRLFNPQLYQGGNLPKSLATALTLHETIKQGSTTPRLSSQVPQDGTHRVAMKAFDHTQEKMALRRPHEFLRASAEASLGRDPQKVGETPVLFAANPVLASELWRGAREQWIAAWLYLRNRYPESELKNNLQLRAELKQIGDGLLQWVRDDPADPSIQALRGSVFAQVQELATTPTAELLARIRELKTRAKNQRDFRQYEAACVHLNDAIAVARAELRSSKLPDWRKTMASELADSHGLLGGVERRWALESRPGSDERTSRLQESITAYDEGHKYEYAPEFELNNTYNALNRLLSRLLLDPSLVAPGRLAIGSDGTKFSVPDKLEEVAVKVKEQNRDDYWSLADLALINILLGKQDAASAYAAFDAKKPPDFAYKSVLDGLTPLIAAGLPMAAELERAEQRLKHRLESQFG